MPFRCPYCGGQFCSAHRLPEAHACPNLHQAQAQKQEVFAPTPARSSYEYKITFGQPAHTKGRFFFSPKELQHLAAATLLVVAIGFSMALYSNFMGYLGWTWAVTSVFAALLTASFLVHEMAHKFMAQRRGFWAEFRLTAWGAVLTFISVFLPFKLISPGAVMISGPMRLNVLGKTSIAGPVVNVGFCAAFLIAASVPSPYFSLFAIVAFINATIAVFNLIPFGILDGYKIYTWNKKVWALGFAAAVALAVPSFLYASPYI